MKSWCLKCLAALLLAVVVPGSAQTAEETGIHSGSKVKFNYTLTVEGKVVDSSQGRDPLVYTHGSSQIIPGLERQLEGLKVGDKKEVDVAPEDGYGPIDPDALVEVPKKELGAPDLSIGMRVGGTLGDGRKVQGTVTEVRGESVMVNFNHPLAGKTLHFSVEIVEIL